MTEQFLDDGLRGWIFKTARKNHWRVSQWYELDDLIQDGYLVYCKCRDRYVPLENKPPTENQRRFMFYFQVSFGNYITDLANQRTVTAVEQICADAPLYDEDMPADGWWAEPESISCALMLANAPTEISTLLRDVLVGAAYVWTRLRKRVLPSGAVRVERFRREVRELSTEHWARVTGRPDTPQLVERYFSG